MREHVNTPAPLVSFTRGTLTESTHFGSVAVADAGGRLIAWAGDAERVTTMRSTAKPFQAMTIVETGTADGFGMSAAELAIIAARSLGEDQKALYRKKDACLKVMRQELEAQGIRERDVHQLLAHMDWHAALSPDAAESDRQQKEGEP